MFPQNIRVVHDYMDDFDDGNVEMIRVGRCRTRPLKWLWPNRIPIGKVTLLVGDPGCGKSLVALDIAARTTRALPWPDEVGPPSRGGLCPDDMPNAARLAASTASVLILSAEDDLADTIRPRLDAAGADSNRVFFLPGITDLREDFEQLRTALNRAPDCRLIIVDPLNAYTGPNNSHFYTVFRQFLDPLARLAAISRLAVVVVAHCRKSHGGAIYRAAGSLGFVAAARAVWTLCRDHAEPSRHYFLPLKTNLTANSPGLVYKIRTHASGYPVIDWDPVSTTISAEIALRPRPEPSPERAAARKWLREFLASGPRPASEIQQAGTECGFLPRTLRRAFHEMNGHTSKSGLLDGWNWSLNDQPSAETDRETPKTFVPFEVVTDSVHRPHDKMVNQQPTVVELSTAPEIAPIQNATVASHPIFNSTRRNLEPVETQEPSDSASRFEPDAKPAITEGQPNSASITSAVEVLLPTEPNSDTS